MNLSDLPYASWDLLSFLDNATSYVQGAGGSLLALMGTAGVVWGGVLLIKKLMASQQDQTSWVKILALILLGGALMVGGFSLISQIAAGGQTTIEDLGGGG
ncbi:hypothetical protein [Nocardiopsis sp. NPDC058789]|uniref:hypothetical protein n=1 Tax=Nocardiopsis sp. NPDC058789 TaxID=3346634 RepID=UPI00366C26F0